MAGIASKRSGDDFENKTQISAKNKKWEILKIPEGCKRIGKSVIPIKSPFDFVAAKNSITIFFDSKTVKSKNFTYSQINQRQIEKLLLLEKTGHIAGYLIYFRSSGAVAFYLASQIAMVEKGEHLEKCLFIRRSANGVFDFDSFINNN